MKSTLIAFGIASVAITMSFAQQSSGNSAAGSGTDALGGASSTGTSRSGNQSTQSQPGSSSQDGTGNQSGTAQQGATANPSGASSTGGSSNAPTAAGPAPNRTGSTDASPDGIRPAAPGIPSGISRTNAGCRP